MQSYFMETITDLCLVKVNNNTLHNWAALNGDNDDDDGDRTERPVQPILYTDRMTSSALVTAARQLGWTVLQVPRVSRAGLPFLKEMYFEAAERFPGCTFYGFSNGDILFDRGLVYSLEAVAQVSLFTFT